MIDNTYVRRIRLYWPSVGDAIELANPAYAIVRQLEWTTFDIEIRRYVSRLKLEP